MAVQGSIKFSNEPFFDLQPNTKVIKIGDGRNTGCYRTDLFTEPFLYVGSFESDITGINEKYFAFQVPQSLTPDSNENYYLLYESTGLEILRRTKSYVRFITPIFEKIK